MLKGACNHQGMDKATSPGTLCILPRLGTSFIRVINPTRFNVSKQIPEELVMRPQLFMQLMSTDIINHKIK